MINLSVNVNKIATLRNSRGGSVPSVPRAVEICLDAGAPGITVHPRDDERHIRSLDVSQVAALMARRRAVRRSSSTRGRPAAGVRRSAAAHPQQCTLVPVVLARSPAAPAGRPTLRRSG
jgi:pyridoxine 5-phosphate synthase